MHGRRRRFQGGRRHSVPNHRNSSRGGGRSSSNHHHQRSNRRYGSGGSVQDFMDQRLNDPNLKINRIEEALRFLAGMEAFNSKPLLLELMVHEQKYGIQRIGEILAHVGAEEDLDRLLIPLLRHGINDETSKPLYLKKQSRYLYAIYLVPGIMDFVAASDNFVASCSKTTADLLCCFLLVLSKNYGEVRNSQAVATVATNLQNRSGDVANCDTLHALLLLKEKEKLKETLERLEHEKKKNTAKEVACLPSDCIPPGGRHSNDHLNVRDILIVPPADELNCEESPYLPLQNKTNRLIEDDVGYLVDRNFRLLREDVLKSMISSLEERRRPWLNARIIGMDFAKGQNAMSFLVQVDPHQQRKIDWKKTKALGSQTIVAFVDKDEKVVRTGVISISNCDEKKGAKKDWLNHPAGPIIGVTIEDPAAFNEALGETARNRRLLKAYNKAYNEKKYPAARGIVSQMKTYEMIEVSKSFFAYSSILKGLQNLDGLPFHDEILRAKTPDNGNEVPDYFPFELTIPKLGDRPSFRVNMGEDDLTAEFLEQNSTLDTSQAKAVKHALTNRVALIQGPPGTGKTFIGGLIAQIILQNTSEKILCLCYTNHALDQFLEHLLEAGNTSIVRLGGRTKSEVLEKYQLFHLSKSKEQHRGSSRVIRSADAEFHREREEIEKMVKDLEASRVNWSHPNGGIAKVLKADYPNEYVHLQVQQHKDGFKVKGKKNKDITDYYLWEEWKQGRKKPPDFALDAAYDKQACKEFWKRPKPQRVAFAHELEQIVLESSRAELRERLAKVKELNEQRDAARRAADLQILKDARIIGATTSGAAKYQDILSSVAPGVIMVEEAGEVLESHVLTALSSRGIGGNRETKHLILIGDHKQLRPKVDTYQLTKVSGKGYDLDVSLFERVILGGLASSCLSTQHRMRPDISSFIRAQTYPHLIDHQSVLKFPDIRGLSQNVVFIDHDHLEDALERDELNANQTNPSKSNNFEAELAVETVRYLLLQGYAPSDLVVLTPYLGQLKKIVRLMERELREVSAFISEKDIEDLEKEGEEELQELNKTENKTVRCSSVDNYQGEESDIVIVSLVRCNDRGTIGFLKEPQRVNVLLSRARHGMIIIGSSKTLLQTTAGEQTWSILLNMMEERGQIKTGLPTVCHLHPEDAPIELCERLNFRSCRPNGGCERKCTFRLPCGHGCPLMCHPVDEDHSVAAQMCVKRCQRIPPECKHNHPCPKFCNQKCGPCKTLMGPVTLPCGHVKQRITCHENRSPEALELVSKRCVEMVDTSFPCGHEAPIACFNARSESPKCPELCGRQIEGCLHPCGNQCSTCDGNNHTCKQKCGRTLFCGHECELPCHHGSECPPCDKECNAVCFHSSCCKSCGESCAPCVEECVWECEHQKRCELVCGAPCTRLPCNKRCQKELSCGHQCPSVCGEPCPQKQYCVECGGDNVKTTVVDMIMMEEYADHDIDSDPIIVLPSCGHFYSVETLDGHFELDKAYEKSPTSGEYVAIKSLFDSGISDLPMKCPDCRKPISEIRRYGRILNYKSLQTLERKHMTGIRKTFENMLARAKKEFTKKELNKLLNLRGEIEATPMKLVQDACQSLGSAEHVEIPGTSTSLLLQWLAITASACGDKAKDINSKPYKTADSLFLEGIELASATESWRSCASLRINYVKFMLRFMSLTDSKAIPTEHLDWVIKMPNPSHDQIATAKELKKQIAGSDIKTLREVVAAMDAGQRDWGFGGGGASGHWYECPNGHPYFIGDCGGAMVTARCFECGAEIGGSSHRALGSNRAWRGVGN